MNNTYDIYKILMDNKGEYVSGEALAKQIGVSRASINKHVFKLKSMGFPIQSSTNSGYRIFKNEDVLNECSLRYVLDKFNFTNINIIYKQSTVSTNTDCKLVEFNGEPTLVCASELTGAKGRRGRGFVAKEGGSYFSIMLAPKNLEVQQSLKSVLLCGVCVVEMLADYGIIASLKYPNDVIVNGKKICGILSEMVCNTDYIERLILGIGINVNTTDFPEEVKNFVTSMTLETGIQYHRSVIIGNVVAKAKKYFDRINNSDFSLIIEDYKKHSNTLGREVKVVENENSFYYGKAIDLDEDGFLIVKTEDGERRVVSADVSIRTGEKKYD